MLHQPEVRVDEVAVPLRLRDTGPEPRPVLRKEPTDAVIEPVDLRRPGRPDCSEDERGDAAGMLLGVHERQGRSPAVSPHEPLLDPEVPAQELDVAHQVRRRVRAQVGGRVARVRRAPTGSPLVEEHDPIRVGVEPTSMVRRTTRARSAVQHQRGLAVRVAAHLPIDKVVVADVEHAALGGPDLGIQPGHQSGANGSEPGIPVRSERPIRRR